MHIASETSKEDVAHARAFPEVEEALRELAANLMRVAAGAGASYDLFRQLPKLADALQGYREAVGHYPSSWHMDRAFDLARGDDLSERQIDQRWYTLRAELDVTVGALRTAASRLLSQRVQVSAGEARMYQGINAILKLRREEAEKREAGQRAALAEAAARKPQTRRESKPKPAPDKEP